MVPTQLTLINLKHVQAICREHEEHCIGNIKHIIYELLVIQYLQSFNFHYTPTIEQQLA